MKSIRRSIIIGVLLLFLITSVTVSAAYHSIHYGRTAMVKELSGGIEFGREEGNALAEEMLRGKDVSNYLNEAIGYIETNMNSCGQNQTTTIQCARYSLAIQTLIAITERTSKAGHKNNPIANIGIVEFDYIRDAVFGYPNDGKALKDSQSYEYLMKQFNRIDNKQDRAHAIMQLIDWMKEAGLKKT